ncbi:MAG: 2-isopropylmalate synthase [Armatimonadetes bacterium]|jgi:2-isopropylmalate synthase|nr:2-isopropylmalate synthase [Armatimonadota bacterium]
MNNRVHIFDTTLRDGEQSPGAALNVDEKLEIARQLERLGVDIIEAGFPISSPGDFDAVQRIAKQVQNATVCGLTRAVRKDIDVAWDALKGAKRPRIHTGLGVSDNHLQHKLRKSRDEALEMGVSAVAYAKSLGCNDIEYFTEDAGRADPDYLCRVVEAVIAAGATVINVPDTTGYATPEEYGAIFKMLLERVSNADKAIFSAHCHDDLGLAVANSLAAAKNGARQIECTVNGIGERAGNTSLEEVVMALHTRRDFYGLETGIQTKEIFKTSRLVSNRTGILVQPNKAIVGANAFAHSSGIHQDGILKERTTYEIMDPADVGISESKIILSPRSGRAALRHRLEVLGHTFEDAGFEKIYERFLTVADRKKTIYDEDLEALATDEARLVNQTYELVQLQVTCGDSAIPTATVKLRHANKAVLMDADTGNGPVDAIYRAINRIVKVPNELIEISLQSVTEGTDAQAAVTIRVRAGEEVFSGHAAHTDIIVAAAKAYLNALNKQLLQQPGRITQPESERVGV